MSETTPQLPTDVASLQALLVARQCNHGCKPHRAVKVAAFEDERERRFLDNLQAGKYPALTAGEAPVHLMARMEAGGMFTIDVASALVHVAAGEIYRRSNSPEQGEQTVRRMFADVLDLIRDESVPVEEEEGATHATYRTLETLRTYRTYKTSATSFGHRFGHRFGHIPV